MTTVGLVSDTHAPRFWKAMPPAVARAFDGVDHIVHAGDVTVPSVLDELAEIAPVTVAQGNHDGDDVVAWGAKPVAELVVAGVRVSVLHDAGTRDGRMPRLRRWFPDSDLVVFGHSHIPYDEAVDGLRAVNPGSPTEKRRQPHGTVALVDLADGVVRDVRFLEVT